MDIYIYIKKTKEDWPIERYVPGLGLVKKKYPKMSNDLHKGYSFNITSISEMEQFFQVAKPMLDDLRKEIVYYLERDELDFTVD